MLPIFTTNQVKDGITSGDFMIDLSEYMKKKDGATKTELQSLTSVVANKLDATPQHKHDISDIKDLQEELDGKYDTSKQYPCNVILSDVEKIAYLESPKVQHLEVAMNQVADGYNFYVDDSSGDLMIVSPASVLIGTYSVASNSWTLGGVNLGELVDLKSDNMNATAVLSSHDTRITANTVNIGENLAKINQLTATMNEYIAKTDAVLKNHYDALLVLCEKHGMVDSNTGDGDKVTPQAE